MVFVLKGAAEKKKLLAWSFLCILLISLSISSCAFRNRSSSLEFSSIPAMSGDDIVFLLRTIYSAWHRDFRATIPVRSLRNFVKISLFEYQENKFNSKFKFEGLVFPPEILKKLYYNFCKGLWYKLVLWHDHFYFPKEGYFDFPDNGSLLSSVVHVRNYSYFRPMLMPRGRRLLIAMVLLHLFGRWYAIWSPLCGPLKIYSTPRELVLPFLMYMLISRNEFVLVLKNYSTPWIWYF